MQSAIHTNRFIIPFPFATLQPLPLHHCSTNCATPNHHYTHTHTNTHTHSLSLSCLFSSQSRTKIQRRKTKTKATNGQSHSAQTHVCTPMHELGCAPRVVNTSAQRAGRVGNAVLLFRLCSHDSTSRTVARPSARRAAALCPPLCTRAVDA